jgi:hypothetical protein
LLLWRDKSKDLFGCLAKEKEAIFFGEKEQKKPRKAAFS